MSRLDSGLIFAIASGLNSIFGCKVQQFRMLALIPYPSYIFVRGDWGFSVWDKCGIVLV